ncbi:MAG: PqqD family protein [Anaerolineae bacterium]|nr:PqqD family protein [Anaerolineae bacterium]
MRRNDKTASRVLAGEAIVLTPQDSKIHSFNETGSRVWELLAEELTVSEIVNQIRGEFEVSEEQAQSDVIAFLEGLEAKGIVTFG